MEPHLPTGLGEQRWRPDVFNEGALGHLLPLIMEPLKDQFCGGIADGGAFKSQ